MCEQSINNINERKNRKTEKMAKKIIKVYISNFT